MPDSRLRTALSWLAAAALIVIVAFVVALPGADDGRPTATSAGSTAPSLLPISFGTALDAQSGEATALAERFASGDNFVYSVPPTGASPAAIVHVEVMREAVEGLEPVQAPTLQEVPEGRGVIAFQVPADDLIVAFGEGSFLMRIYLDPAAAPIAEGRFRLVAPPAGESPAP